MIASKNANVRAIVVVASLAAVLCTLLLPSRTRPVEATPIFAQAYGLKCTACHMQVPILNAFGRYVQRTAYGALDYRSLQHTIPLFIFDPGTGYSYQAGRPSKSYRVSDPLQTTILYAAGDFGPKFSYNAEHGVTLAGQPGWLTNAWVAYHGLLGGRGHVSVGKLTALNLDEFGGPSLLSDVTNDALPAQIVSQGVHNYYFDYNQGRFGAKFSLVEKNYAAEFAYLGNDSNTTSFDHAYDFSRSANRSVQYKTAYADPSRPWEAGLMGEVGTYGWIASAVPGAPHQDHYAVVGPYFIKDPRPGSPGFRFEYQTSTDDDTGYLLPASPNARPVASGPTHGSWMTGSIYQMLLSDNALVNLTYYHTNSALGPLGSPFGPFTGFVGPTGSTTSGELGFSYAITRFVRVYTTSAIVQHQHPIFSVNMWLTPPVSDRR